MLHMWCCAHAMLCIYSVCTCSLCNVMYKVVQIVLCECCKCSARYRWCYVHDRYAVLCSYGIVRMMDMGCCVHVVYEVLCTYSVVCMFCIWCYVHMVLCAWRNDYLCKWMAWQGSWSYGNQVGRVVMTNIWGQYHVDMNWYFILVLCLCLCYDR